MQSLAQSAVAVSPPPEIPQLRSSYPGTPIQYRIEERRCTIFVTSTVPPSEWDPGAFNEIFSCGDIPESELKEADPQVQVGVGHGSRRTRSMTDRQTVVFDDGSNQATGNLLTPRSHRGRHGPSRTAVNREARNVPKSPPRSPLHRGAPPIVQRARPRILFYHKHEPHYGFTNFSPHPVEYNGKIYPTSEHLFQSFKFEHKPNLMEHIRTCSDKPSVVFSEARRFAPEVRTDWMQVNIEKMDVALWHKFTQHHDLKAELLATGNAELVEDSDKDAFWGIGADHKGRNELGKALERVRDRLRAT